MDASQITPAQRITVIKHALHDRTDEFIATATGLSAGTVRHILDAAGAPNVDQMRRLLERLEDTSSIDVPTAPRSQRQATTVPRLSTATTAPPRPSAPAATVSLNVSELIVQASLSPKVRTRNLGTKLATLLEELQTTLRVERKAAEARAEAEAAKARNAARIAELEAELAKLRGPKRTTAAATSGEGSSSKEIRAWAAENGIACPAFGRVPADVRQAYDDAHTEAVAS